jgi:hypothetical protein
MNGLWSRGTLRYARPAEQGSAAIWLPLVQHPELPQQILGRIPLSSRVLKVLVIRPQWNLKMKGESQDFYIVGIAASDPAFCLIS